MRLSFVLATLAALALSGCGGGSGGSGSATATPSTLALAQNHAHSIAIMPHNPNDLLLGAHYRLYRSTDGGKTWKPLLKQMVLSMALDPAHPTTIFAVSVQGGLQKSVDGGRHWRPSGTGIGQGHATGVTFDPANRAVFAYGVGIYRSADGGAHWSTVLPKQSIQTVAAGSGGTLYAASVNGLYASHDAGIHWALVSAIGNQPVIQVAASGPVAYAVAAVALMKSTDNGHTWKPLGKAPSGIEFLGVSPTNPNEVFGEIGGHGFVASHDGGVTWHPANSGIADRNFNASVIRVSPSSPNVVYTAAWGLHFYASHDGGKHWTRTATLVH